MVVILFLLCAIAVAEIYYSSQRRGPKGTVKLLLLLGQSNMEGAGNGEALPQDYQVSPDRVSLFWRGRWQRLRPYCRKDKKLGITRTAFGPEISLGHELAKRHPDENFAFFKYAVGGTRIVDWLPAKEEENLSDSSGGKMSLYSSFMKDLKRATTGFHPIYIAVLWLQGESDSRTREDAEKYEENLRAFIKVLRENLGREDLFFVIGEVSNVADKYTETVLAAQRRISQTNPHVILLQTQDLGKHPDRLHYNTEGQIQLGVRFADILSKYKIIEQ